MQFRFSSCGVLGSVGPNQSIADSCYKETNVKVQIVAKGIQKWKVPLSGVYVFEAAGAAGCKTNPKFVSGKGVLYKSKFLLKKNDILYILIGQQGTFPDNNDWGGPGGGATFIAKRVSKSQHLLKVDNAHVIPLLVAAGGGGTGDGNSGGSQKNGGDGLCETAESGAGTNNDAKGGAGFNKCTADGSIKSFLEGGESNCVSGTNGLGCGGFGCGGTPANAGAGGGGYKGGNSNSFGLSGSGGYSFNSGSKISCEQGKNDASGYAKIELIYRIYDQTLRNRSNTWLLQLILVFTLS